MQPLKQIMRVLVIAAMGILASVPDVHANDGLTVTLDDEAAQGRALQSQTDTYTVANGIVTGDLSDEEQALFEEQASFSGARHLLNRSSIPKCPGCKLVRCSSKSKFCSGTCRRGKKIVRCSPRTPPPKPKTPPRIPPKPKTPPKRFPPKKTRRTPPRKSKSVKAKARASVSTH